MIMCVIVTIYPAPYPMDARFWCLFLSDAYICLQNLIFQHFKLSVIFSLVWIKGYYSVGESCTGVGKIAVRDFSELFVVQVLININNRFNSARKITTQKEYKNTRLERYFLLKKHSDHCSKQQSNKTAKYKTSDNVEQSSTKDQSPLIGVLYMEPDQTKKPLWIIHHQTQKNPMKDTIQDK